MTASRWGTAPDDRVSSADSLSRLAGRGWRGTRTRRDRSVEAAVVPGRVR